MAGYTPGPGNVGAGDAGPTRYPSVLTEPADVDREALTQVLTWHWSVQVASLDYLAVGFGSHHWVATDDRGRRWFVTVDDLRNARWTETPYDQVRRAFETARALHRDAGLEFVLAPTPDDTGAVVRHLGAHHSVAVFPFLDATSAEFGDFPSVADRRAVLGLVGRLHAATDRIPADLPRREDFDLPGRRHLLAAMAHTDEPWRAGPFGEPARELRAPAPPRCTSCCAATTTWPPRWSARPGRG